MDFEKTIKAKDTALAFVFLFLIFFLFFHWPWALWVCFSLALLALITHKPFLPLSRLWFGLSHLLGEIVSKILLSLVFFIFLTPLSIIFRLSKKNPLFLKNEEESLFEIRNHSVTADDLKNAF